MSRIDPQVNLRIPKPLKEELEALAKQNRRSLTAEIVDRLEKSVGDVDEMGVSDRERLDPNHAFYVPYTSDQVTTKIHRERLLIGLDAPLSAQEEKIMSAMIKALRYIGKYEEEGEEVVPRGSKGPKPRKRYPKE
ncbi:Arc family DNA-binding protein [Pseudomonas sp. NPDC088368]|uniref:Arc family DNA-binding protein n=1 Tax=Pseudomonas sp. NPDC088368 TaxID=3364453 RepID=UPI00382B7CC9